MPTAPTAICEGRGVNTLRAISFARPDPSPAVKSCLDEGAPLLPLLVKAKRRAFGRSGRA